MFGQHHPETSSTGRKKTYLNIRLRKYSFVQFAESDRQTDRQTGRQTEQRGS